MKSMQTTSIVLGVALLGAAIAQSPTSGKPAELPKHNPTYATMLPFLTENCIKCHNDQHARAHFDIQNYEAMIRGGEDGVMIKKGDPANSPIIAYLKGTRKPQMPAKSPPLSESQIKIFETWIKNGAKEK